MRSEYMNVWGTCMCMSVYLLHSSEQCRTPARNMRKDFGESFKNKISKEPKPM